MLEICVRSDNGWLPLSCHCPAGRAVFRTEAAAASAIDQHLSRCPGESRTAPGHLRDAFRTFAVEAIPG